MRDKRPVDELSVEELERILAIKKREERMQRVGRMQRSGRVIEVDPQAEPEPEPASSQVAPAAEAVAPGYDPVAAALASLTQPVVHESVQPKEKERAPRFEESAEPSISPAQKVVNTRKRRRVMDRLLLVIEVVAVILIGVVGVNLLQAIGKMDQVTAQAQQEADAQRRATIPTIAPTPAIRVESYILPDGHTYGANPQFNMNEVPAFLQPRVQSEWVEPVLSRPAQTSETALALIVPKLSLNATIVQGVDWDALKEGVGQVPNGVNPGDDVGNVSFAAHNDIYGQLFRHLDQLQPGDTFQIQTKTNVYTYTITQQKLVAPTDVSVLDNRQGATATLISCYPYQVDNQRIVIFANRLS
ncbi:MAG TPA: sortase [Phototrophicaceae bacterium]|nr:sortase [Phototrophicaceae bacterium]